VTARPRLVAGLAAAVGAAAFLPVGSAYLGLALLAAAMFFADRQAASVRWARLAGLSVRWMLLAFVAWPTIVLLLSPVHEGAGSRLFHVFRVAAVLALGLMLDERERRAALLGFVGAALVACLVVAAHHAWGLPQWSVWHNLLTVRGNDSTRHMLMLACAAGVSLWMALRPGAAPSERTWFAAAWLLPSVVVALHAASRNAYLLLVMLPVLACVYRLRSGRRTAVGIAVGTSVGAAVAAVGWFGSPALRERVLLVASDLEAARTGGEYGGSASVRWRMYEEAWNGMLAHPWTGTGLGSWRKIWDEVGGGHQIMGGMNNPHNDFLHFGIETGVPGLLLVAALLAWFVVRGWRAGGTAGGAAFLLASAVTVTALLNAPLRDAGLGMVMLWLMAAATSNAAVPRPGTVPAATTRSRAPHVEPR
jgi:O-antigen ligase